MPETPTFLAERLRAEGERIAASFTALTGDQWQQVVYTESAEWKVRDILAHFVSLEKSILKLFENIRDGGEGASEDFSVDRFNAEQVSKLTGMSPPDLLAQFKASRAQMIAWVSSLSESDLQKKGRHPFLGVTTLGEMIKMVYRHNQIHLRDLRNI
jgi:uncharacterized protein (TIGR03083 family)